MKRFLAIQGCIAVFSAFLLAPFTHVHDASSDDEHVGHEHSAIVHSHISFDAPEVRYSSQTSIRQPSLDRIREQVGVVSEQNFQPPTMAKAANDPAGHV